MLHVRMTAPYTSLNINDGVGSEWLAPLSSINWVHHSIAPVANAFSTDLIDIECSRMTGEIGGVLAMGARQPSKGFGVPYTVV